MWAKLRGLVVSVSSELKTDVSKENGRGFPRAALVAFLGDFCSLGQAVLMSSLTQECSRPSGTTQLPQYPQSCHPSGCRGAPRQGSCWSHALQVARRAVVNVAASAQERLLNLSISPHTRLPAWLLTKTTGSVCSPKSLFSRGRRPVPGGHRGTTWQTQSCTASGSVLSLSDSSSTFSFLGAPGHFSLAAVTNPTLYLGTRLGLPNQISPCLVTAEGLWHSL